MRVIRIKSNYVLGNMTDRELSVLALAVPSSSTKLHPSVVELLGLKSVSLSPAGNSR